MPKKITCPFCDGDGQEKQYDFNVSPPQVIDTYHCQACNGTGARDNTIFTCFECKDNETCRSAYDIYNTNGDCLESK